MTQDIWFSFTEVENLLFTEELYSTELVELYMTYVLSNLNNKELLLNEFSEIEYFKDKETWKIVITEWIHQVVSILYLYANIENWNLKKEELKDEIIDFIKSIEWKEIDFIEWVKTKTLFEFDNDNEIEEIIDEWFEISEFIYKEYEKLVYLENSYFKNHNMIIRLKWDDLKEDKRSFFQKLFS